MSELALSGVVDGPLLGVNARFGPGAVSVVGVDAAALANLVSLVAGAHAPRRGRVLLDGVPLAASPERRRVTASVFAEEPLPALASVGDALRAILAARGDRRDSRAVLEPAGLADWSARRPSDLDASERRTLALALALAHPNPRLVALYEPLAVGRRLDARFVREGIARALAQGAVVIVATQSLDDARALGGAPWLLHGGVLADAAGAPLGGFHEAERSFVVETPDARRLAAALARDAAVRGVRWDETSAPDTVFVFGSDTEELASAVARVLAEESLRARTIALAPVPLAALLAQRPGAAAFPPGAGTPSFSPQALGIPAPYVPGAAAPATPLEATAPAPPDQSVTMPASFADPTRPSGGSGG